jgi:death-on-curing family protein
LAEVRYLTADEVIALTERFFAQLGYARPMLRSQGQGLLESAVDRARTAAYYGDADLIAQAAALTNGIALNHAFIDGNKRCAWAACVTFLESNGHGLPRASLVPLARQLIALHETTDRSQADLRLAEWLRAQLP